MLAKSSYPQEYIDGARAQIAARISAFDALSKAVDKGGAVALADFETLYFNDLVFVLDVFFTHRTRGVEGKNGNPINEVRVLTMSFLENGGHLGVDSTIKLKPETSVLGLQVGDEIKLTAADFTRLADAYFDEMDSRFGAKA